MVARVLPWLAVVSTVGNPGEMDDSVYPWAGRVCLVSLSHTQARVDGKVELDL